MNNQKIFQGTVTEVLNSSYITIRTNSEEIIPCYVVKKVASKNWTPNVGVSAVFGGGFKTFANGINYFVIHKIENEKLGSYQSQTYVDKNENLPYLRRVQKAIENAPCRKGYDSKSVKCELVDGETNEILEFSLKCIKDEKKFYGDSPLYKNWKTQEKYGRVFFAPWIFKEFNNANLANKKWGSKVEGKLKVQIVEIRRKGVEGENWEYLKIEDLKEEIRKVIHSGKTLDKSTFEWEFIGRPSGVYFQVSKVRIVVQK